ncbi:hypothetical protein [Magnetofaba australis]|nr:hypothetical protein [Magnetofaba australis]
MADPESLTRHIMLEIHNHAVRPVGQDEPRGVDAPGGATKRPTTSA